MAEGELILGEWSGGGNTLTLSCLVTVPDNLEAGDFVIAAVKLSANIGADDDVVSFKLVETKDIRVEAPAKLLIAAGDKLRIRDRNQLEKWAEEEWAAAKQTLRRRLAQPLMVEKNSDFLGVTSFGGSDLTIELFLNAQLVDGFDLIADKSWLLRAVATADLSFTYSNDTVSLPSMAGRLSVTATLKKGVLTDLLDIDFGFDLPEISGLDLNLPQLKLPSLKLVTMDFGDWLPSMFSLPLPSFLGEVAFTWTPPPQVKVHVQNRDLAIETTQEGEGDLELQGSKILGVRKLAIGFAAKQLSFKAVLSAPAITSQTIRDIQVPPKNTDDSSFPFVLSIGQLTVTPKLGDLTVQHNGTAVTLAHAGLELRLGSDKVMIWPRNDPGLAIALKIELKISYADRKTRTELTKLALVEPYPIELVAKAGQSLGELIRFIAAIPVPAVNAPSTDPLLQLLERLGRMLAAAARWLAEQAGGAAKLLAGLVEGVLEAILDLGRAIAALGNAIVSHVAIEVRLDPRTFRLRQIVLMPVMDKQPGANDPIALKALGFDFIFEGALKPALVIDVGPESWIGIVVQTGGKATLATDLWLDKAKGPQQTVGSATKTSGAAPDKRLIEIVASPIAPPGDSAEIVLAAIQRGRLKLFQAFEGAALREELEFGDPRRAAVAIRETGRLTDGGIKYDGGQSGKTPIVEVAANVDALKERVLSLFSKAGNAPNSGSGGFFDSLQQKIEVTGATPAFADGALQLKLDVIVHIDKDFAPQTQLTISASLRDFSMKLAGAERISIMTEKRIEEYNPLGLDLVVRAKESAPKTYEQFYLDLSDGEEAMGLGKDATAELSFGKVSTSGKGLQFEVSTLKIGRSGFDLDARILPEPVRLGGVDVPFRFTSGSVSIKGSKFNGGALAGAGKLPSALVGEANASVALQLGAGPSGEVVVESATARLDKSGDPIRCNSTRFDLTITELGFDYKLEGSYHFYFLLTGTAVFKPGGSEYASGLLKNFRDVTIKLDKAPLAADPRVLMRSIEFQVKVDPPKKMSFFDLFSFELRGFGFHPAAPKFDGDPAMSISGQVRFADVGDLVSPHIDFHSMWIAGPKPGSSKPRIRFDGLGVGIKTGAVNVEATAIAIDGAMPELYLPPGGKQDNIAAEGFLAKGRLDIQGWASMSAAMGFLELREKDNPASRPKHSFFLYGQMEKLAVPIQTPIARIYLREFGFGFGYRYTLAGIARAETAKSPQELVKVLDGVSKYQGSLNQFQAWEPTYHNNDLTLALRGMFALAARENQPYTPDDERDLPNALLFDIVAAFRTDFTFLINLRAWVSVNYYDWVEAGDAAGWKNNPTMRGYLYFSVPRKEFLGRFLSDGTGHVGKNPALPEPLADAIKKSKFSATLYIRPGLFHAELGWPYELGFELGKKGGNFYLSLTGGLIHRIEDSSMLTGIAFKAVGEVHLEGRIGSSSLGAAAVAHANFAIEARVLSYLSLKDFGESFYYGYLRIDIAVDVRVEVWISFKIFGKRIRLSAGFSLYLAVSIALEAVISPGGLGGRAHVSIGVRAFGRSLSVSIGFSFNDNKLAETRAKVARFMELGLAAPIPDRSQDGQRIESNPKSAPSGKELAAIGDDTLSHDIGKEPPPEDQSEEFEEFRGEPIRATDFWAVLYPTAAPDDLPHQIPSPADPAVNDWYVMQLVPRDHTPVTVGERPSHLRATFYASPNMRHKAVDDAGNPITAPWHRLDFEAFAPHPERAPKMRQVIDGPLTKWIPLGSATTLMTTTVVDAVVAKQDGGVSVGDLLESLFLGKTPDGMRRCCEEPSPRYVDLAQGSLPPDAKASARELGRIGRGRSNLTGRVKREAEIDEARSAVLSDIIDHAAVLAAGGAAGGWPARAGEGIDARDFGLTFIVNRSAVAQLFEGDRDSDAPPLARFSVFKSDTITHKKGRVQLFNDPTRMFRERQPCFKPIHTIEAQGIKLDWNLEPAWGASLGAYHDPEFHLRHYRIRRYIRGTGDGNDYRALFTAKAGSAIRYVSAGDGEPARLQFTRPEFQFIDDLRAQDAQGGRPAQAIPDHIRKALLNQATNDELEGLKLEGLNIVYEIVPIDVAGTSDFGEVHVVDGFTAPKLKPRSPREAVLQVVYDGMPTNVSPSCGPMGAALEPTLTLLSRPAVYKDKVGNEIIEHPEPDNLYVLRIHRFKVEPSGGYGADALDDSLRRPDQASIDRLPPIETTDILLKVVAAAPILNMISQHADDEAGTTFGLVATRIVNLSREGEELKLGKPYQDIGELRKVFGISSSVSDECGWGRRLFLRKIEIADHVGNSVIRLDRAGEWRTLTANLVVLGAGKALDEPTISSTVELLEQPVHVEFAALKRADMRAQSGRVSVVQPSMHGALGDLADRQPAFAVVPDAARRTAMRLEWNARPTTLDCVTTAGDKLSVAAQDLHRWIGGYEVFSIDPESLTEAGADLVSEIEDLAQPLGRVALLPRSMHGLDPAGFGDLGRIESAYPSTTLRLQHAPSNSRSGGVRKAGWYSTAESTAIFPQPAVRRSLMPEPDEGLIAGLFSGGAPQAIRISLPGWTDSQQPGWADKVLEGWAIEERNKDDTTGWDEYQKPLVRFAELGPKTTEPQPDTSPFSVTFGAGSEIVGDRIETFDAPALRRLLQNLRLAPADRVGPLRDNMRAFAETVERKALQRRLVSPDHMAAVKVRVEAVRFVGAAGQLSPRIVATQEISLDLMPRLHPVLGDALAFLQYDAQLGDLASANGATFRRYALSPDSNPEVTTEDFGSYVDEVPSERDPYGWGALRTLGLATAFRLYDTEEKDYVRFGAKGGLAGLIRAAFARALARYDQGTGRDNGQPFLDILTQPWGNVTLSWFDGGDRAPTDQEVEHEMLAVVQLSLRPHPDRLEPTPRSDHRLCRYYALTAKGAPHFGAWSIALTGSSRGIYDVLGVAGGIVAQKPVRLDEKAPKVEVYEPRLAVVAPGKAHRRVIAVVRTTDEKGDPRLQVSPSEVSPSQVSNLQNLEWIEIARPLVMSVLDGQAPARDEKKDPNFELAYGRFEPLTAADWQAALFRAEAPDENKIHESVQRLGYYAGRRFKPLSIVFGGADVTGAAAARTRLTDQILRFWARFLDHCAPAWGDAPPRGGSVKAKMIFFSLGTVADPGQWRRAPNASGTVSVVVVDAERRGARRKLTVRPYSRYEAWSNAAPIKSKAGQKIEIEKRTGLQGAFLPLDVTVQIGAAYFVDTTLPRTEPVEKPVILSSVTRPPKDSAPGKFELVVAHSSDMVLAQSNRRNAAMLAPLDLSVGFWREFAHPRWLEELETLHGLKLEPMASFGALDRRLDLQKHRIERGAAEARLTELRQRVPDAWLGSTVITASAMPYFYRTHALVHAAAGIVVSEQSTTTFQEGFYDIDWPYKARAGGSKLPQKTWYKGRVDAEPHRFSVHRVRSDDNGVAKETTVVTFEISALRFIDCMFFDDAKLWFGDDGKWNGNDALKRVGHLPEPGVSYRISVVTSLKVKGKDGLGKPVEDEEILARAQEIDVMPILPMADEVRAPPPRGRGLYMLQVSGSRFKARDSVLDKAPRVDPIPDGKNFKWRIDVEVSLAKEPTPLVRILDANLDSLKRTLSHLPCAKPMPPAIDGLRVARLHITSDTNPQLVKDLIEALTDVADSPEAAGALSILLRNGIPPTMNDLAVELGSKSAGEPAVKDAIQAIHGSAIGDVDRIILRRPPNDAELQLFATHGTPALSAFVNALAAEQLLGPGRGYSVSAAKGSLRPIHDAFARRIGGRSI